MILDPWFYLLAILAVLITGISKGGFGGIALLAVPFVAIADVEKQHWECIRATDNGAGAFSIGLSNNVCH